MTAMNAIQVEVAYATPQTQWLTTTQVNEGASVRDVIAASGILARFPEINLDTQAVGIFSKVCTLDQPVRAGDRVEIYRPLIADPKEARRRRAAKQR